MIGTDDDLGILLKVRLAPIRTEYQKAGIPKKLTDPPSDIFSGLEAWMTVPLQFYIIGSITGTTAVCPSQKSAQAKISYR